MPRVLLACEGGAGRGHVVTLKTIAEALEDRFLFDAALCRMEHADEIRPACDAVYPGASLPYLREERRARGNVPAATWGEFMGDTGFRDHEFLSRQIAWWQEVIRVRDIALVVGDFAPCALLAARSVGVPAVAVGNGYTTPPPGLEAFPVFLPQYAERIFDEAGMVECVNRAATPLGVPPLRWLPEVYTCETQLVCTLPMLDPYAGNRREPLLPPVTGLSSGVDIGGGGEEVFIYFSTTELAEPGMVEAVADLGVPTRTFMPGIEPETARRLEASGVTVERAPVPPNELVRRTRLMVNAGQHGTLCTGLAAGIPQVAIPQQLEQLYNATRAGERGVARVVEKGEGRAERLRQTILEAYHDEGMRRAAVTLARELQPFFLRSGRMMIRRRIATLL